MSLTNKNKSIVDTLTPKSPLYIACHQPPIKFIKSANYGVKKLWARINLTK